MRLSTNISTITKMINLTPTMHLPHTMKEKVSNKSNIYIWKKRETCRYGWFHRWINIEQYSCWQKTWVEENNILIFEIIIIIEHLSLQENICICIYFSGENVSMHDLILYIILSFLIFFAHLFCNQKCRTLLLWV